MRVLAGLTPERFVLYVLGILLALRWLLRA